jgi:fructose/tagatose bisphosphate aldolase
VTLVPLPDQLAAARAGGYAVGYFEAWDGDSLEAVVAAAEAERAPVILGFGCLLVDPGWLDAGGIERLGRAGRVVAELADVPVSFLLNEACTLDQALRGLDAGFNAVMLAGAETETVARLVGEARPRGIAVEGELGTLPDGHDASAASLTDPDEAARFVAATGVDCLAVSFGNVHGGSGTVDLDRLAAVHDRVGIPLAVHGGSGFPRDTVQAAIERGAAKFNVGKLLKQAFLDGLAVPAGADPYAAVGSHGASDVVRSAAASMIPVVRDLIRLYGSSGRA